MNLPIKDQHMEEGRAQHWHQHVELSFDDITYKVPFKKGYKTLLKGVSGVFRSGEFTAILGPSGAGKTTLAQVLAGNKTRNVSGEIRVNGSYRNLYTFRKLACFLMADDQLLPYLTVTESMMASACLKLPEAMTKKRKLSIIRDILTKLGLNNCSNTMTHQLSGGQQKRLNIALELVNNPPLLFFDEPTSGLDSQSCFQCISLLKSLAMNGRTVVCTIHQPSARLLELFDKIFVLTDGEFIYKGTVPEMLPYLKSFGLECPPYHNPADFVIDVACGDYGSIITHKLAQAVRGSQSEQSDRVDIGSDNNNGVVGQQPMHDGQLHLPDKETRRLHEIRNFAANRPSWVVSYSNGTTETIMDTSDCRPFAAGSFTQFKVLLWRNLKSMSRDTHLTRIRLAAHVIVGLLIGTLYFGVGNDATKILNNIGYLYFSILFLVFTAMMPTIMTFPLEAAVFTREHANRWYDLKSYYFAKTLADLPFQIFFPVLYSVITYWMTGQPTDRFLLFMSICVLVSFTAQSLGLFIGAGMSFTAAIFCAPAATIPMVLFSGFFLTVDAMPYYLRWLSYMSYLRYGYQGALLAIYGGGRPPLACGDVTSVLCMMSEPSFILEAMGMKEAKMWFDVMILVVFLVGYRMCCYCVLLWRVRRSR